MTRIVKCVKLGKEAEGLDFAPMGGELGKRIFENVSKQAWQMWLNHQTMLINEYRLNLLDQSAKDLLKKEAEKFFFGSGSDKPQGYIPPENQ